MLRDMERGGRIEADHIIGDMISRGRARNLPAPLLEIAYIRLQAYQNAQKASA
jgi:2-dehydropantoate 2-reductase